LTLFIPRTILTISHTHWQKQKWDYKRYKSFKKTYVFLHRGSIFRES